MCHHDGRSSDRYFSSSCINFASNKVKVNNVEEYSIWLANVKGKMCSPWSLLTIRWYSVERLYTWPALWLLLTVLFQLIHYQSHHEKTRFVRRRPLQRIWVNWCHLTGWLPNSFSERLFNMARQRFGTTLILTEDVDSISSIFSFFWWDLMDSSPDYGTSCAHGEMCTRSSVRVLWLAGNWMSLHFFLESGPTFCGPLIVTHFRVWHVDEEGSWQGQHRRPFAVDTLGQHNKHAALSFSSHSIPSSPRPILHRSQTAVQILPVPSLNFSCDHRQ